MSALVIGDHVQILFAQDQWSLRADKNLIQRLVEAVLRDGVQVAARCQQRSLVDQVGEISAYHARCAASDGNQIDIFGQWHIARVNLQDCQAAVPVGTFYCDAAVKAARTQQGFIESVRPVGRGDDYHCLARIKAIHLYQQLVERLFALVVAIDAGPTLAAYGVDFIDEDDTRRSFFGLIKQVAHAARAHANQHLYKLGTADGEERHTSFTGYRTGQQGFTSSRRTYKQHTAWNPATEFLEFSRRLQKFDYFYQVIFGLVNTCYIREGRAGTVFQYHLCPALAEAEDVLLPLRGTARDEEEYADHQYPGQEVDEDREPETIITRCFCLVADMIIIQQFGEIGITVGKLGKVESCASFGSAIHISDGYAPGEVSVGILPGEGDILDITCSNL